ncbi:MAG: hypothetical protein PHI97_19525 [Desulfobulbus sp.]|nr:hypothetical protein [Desulfobulbus sp.]
MDINIKRIIHEAERIAVCIAMIWLCITRLIRLAFIWLNFCFLGLLLLLGGIIFTVLFFSAFTPSWLMIFGNPDLPRGVLWVMALAIASVLCFLWFSNWQKNGLRTAKSETKKIMEGINGEIEESEILVRFFARCNRDNSGTSRNTGN